MCQTKKKSLSIPRIQSGVSLACVSVVLLEGVCLRADEVEGRGNEAKGEGSFLFSCRPIPIVRPLQKREHNQMQSAQNGVSMNSSVDYALDI